MSQSILMYSESGLGKTTSVGIFARYQFARTGKPTRLVTCDSTFGPCQDEVDEGIIIPIRLEACPMPISTLIKISKGYWPKKAIDVKEGLWECNDISDFIPLFKMPNVRYGAAARVPEARDVCGGYAIEGLTRIAELAAKALVDDQRATGEPLVGLYEEMGEKFAFESRGTYKGVQRIVSNVVVNFRAFPVDRVFWTAHESKGKDSMGLGRTILGPAAFGPALTDKIPGWFAIVLHNDSYAYVEPSRKDPRKMVNRTAIRSWFRRHPDIELPKMFWPAKLGLSPQLTGAMYEYFEEGFMPLILDLATGRSVQGIDTFLSIIDNGGSLGAELPEQPVEVEPPNQFVNAPVVGDGGEAEEPAK